MKTRLGVSGATKEGAVGRARAASPRIVSADVLQGRSRELYDVVARRAYEIFEQRGRVHGAHEDDWFRAEAELLQPVEAEITDAGSALRVRAEVRGFAPSEIEVGVEPRCVTIAGSHRESAATRKGNVVRAGGCASRLLRVVELPYAVDAADVTASVKGGVLEVTLRKAGAVTVRRAG